MPKINNVPYEFINEIENGVHTLTLSGNIRKRYWDEDKAIDADLVRDALDEITNDVVIKLNSNGGDVFQGIEIYNYLKDHPSKITVEVTGVAASAATFIVAGADKAIMSTGTTFMIHEASSYAWGNKSELKKVLNALETIDESILSIYESKTGQTKEQLNDWMETEKWFSAEEAVKYNFADEVKQSKKELTNEIDITAMINDAVAKAMKAQEVTAQVGPETVPEPEAIKAKTAYEKYIKKGANK